MNDAIRLAPLLDEVTTLRASGSQAISFFRLQSLLSAVIGALAPQSGLLRSLCLSRHRFSGGRASVSVPRWRRFQPVRAEVRAVEAPLSSDISRGGAAGDCRIIYEIHGDQLIVLVLRVGRRREIYESR